MMFGFNSGIVQGADYDTSAKYAGGGLMKVDPKWGQSELSKQLIAAAKAYDQAQQNLNNASEENKERAQHKLDKVSEKLENIRKELRQINAEVAQDNEQAGKSSDNRNKPVR
jgi:uncharacterized protein (DUF885 family)